MTADAERIVSLIDANECLKTVIKEQGNMVKCLMNENKELVTTNGRLEAVVRDQEVVIESLVLEIKKLDIEVKSLDCKANTTHLL